MIAVGLKLTRCPGLEDIVSTMASEAAAPLVASATPLDDEAVSWPHPNGKPALTGFAHGTAGNAWALAEASAYFSDRHFADKEAAGLAYEMRALDETSELWRHPAQERARRRTPFLAWCHGAPGMTLARLLIARSLPKSTFPGTARESHGIADDPGLSVWWQWLAGNIELLLVAGGDERSLALGAVEASLDKAREHGWSCGVDGANNPGLMLGLAGVGLQLSRLGDETWPNRCSSRRAARDPGDKG